MSKSQISIEKFYSKSLEDNPLNDPVIRKIPVYLPPGYTASDKSYPVIYLLTGFSGRGTMMMNDSLWEETIQERMDRLIQSGTVQPTILVLPDCSTRLGGSQYINSSATGQYKDHLLELVEHIDNKYRTIASREFRAVAGKSSGGYGAMMLGMHHPDIFGLVADHSGDKYFELCYKPDFPKWLQYYSRVGNEGILQMLEKPGSIRPKSGDFFYALNISAMASCYSPNPNTLFGFDLPFDLYTGELRPDIWAKWEENDPVYQIINHTSELKDLRLLFFDCGNQDEYNLQYGARIFARRLENHQIPFEYEEFDDGHRGLNYRYDVSLGKISKAFPKSP